MGLAASQARLLTITARLADNELRSQTINNAKMRLATQSSQASENYINALNNATLKFSSYDEAGNALTQDLTYNALTAYSSYNTQYGLINSAGQILVSEAEADLFRAANGNLNAYLLAHGLEYTTTYFDELGAIKNDAYPVPFNDIEVEEMETFYAQYGSYENSLEVENYEKNYGEFIKAENQLVKGAESSLEAYLLYANNTPKIYIPSGKSEYQYDYTSNISSMVTYFKTLFTSTSSDDTYNLNNLNNAGILSDEYTSQLLETINNSISVSNIGYLTSTGDVAKDINGDRKTQTGLILTDEAEIVSEAADGKTTYTINEGIVVTVNSDGKVESITISNEMLSDGQTAEITMPRNDDGNVEYVGLTFDQLVQSGFAYKVKTPGDTENPTPSYDEYWIAINKVSEGNYSATSSVAIFDTTQAQQVIASQTNSIINAVLAIANYENFAELLLQDNFASSYGIDTSKIIPSVNKTLAEILTNYKESKNSFLNNIFDDQNPVTVDGVTYTSSKDYVEAAMKDGIVGYEDPETKKEMLVTPENLTDIDFVLQFLKAKGLQQSESFNTVIKEFIVDEIISVYGEPKYAWVDQNDTTNSGNADAKAQWYTNLFNRMNQGFKALENGLGASKEWLEYAFEAGIVTLEQVDKNFKWNGLDYRTCTKITEVTDDAAVAKAEAEYNRAMNDIEAKDNIFDMELKNIDTEHNALQTEYDVIKGVIDKNISRTFKFNQSA